MHLPSEETFRKDVALTYRCIRTGVHVVPLQVMVGQFMRSSGICVRCGREVTASTSDSNLGSYPQADTNDVVIRDTG